MHYTLGSLSLNLTCVQPFSFLGGPGPRHGREHPPTALDPNQTPNTIFNASPIKICGANDLVTNRLARIPGSVFRINLQFRHPKTKNQNPKISLEILQGLQL
ncbi:hypothetical protein PIIN_08651 [Serendipita indica DSM 11827]|uniref:Uncharacterized protein n=1 Tax=Serendipita indica (strain DSM 11827) TaxID=1109443 RepID=G4U2A5_SERID|nr:hypothetical protein PIIN_08651 [Serendipita indica DSM 11827]